MIGFVCNSAYQLLISAIVKDLFYNGEEAVLLLDNYFYANNCKEYNFTCQSFFDYIWVAPDNLMKEKCETLMKEWNFSVLHFFNWGSEISNYLYDNINSKVIVLDEGMGSYRLKEIWGGRISFDKISEVWLVAPELSLDNFTEIKLKRIPLLNITKDKERYSKLIKELDNLYNYKYKDLPQVIYFDRYFLSENTLPQLYEKKLVNTIIECFGAKGVGVKIHPSEDKKLAQYRYSEFDVELIDDYSIPWELMLLHMKNKITILSINSTPIIYSMLIARELNICIESICLINLVGNAIHNQELYIIPLIKKYNDTYPQKSIFLPSSVYDLKRYCSGKSIKRNELVSYDELEKNYIRLCTQLGNFIDAVFIGFDSEQEGNTFGYYSLLDEKISRMFCVNTNSDKVKIVISYFSNQFFVKEILIKINNQIVYEKLESIVADRVIELSFNDAIKSIEVCFEIVYPLLRYDYKNI